MIMMMMMMPVKFVLIMMVSGTYYTSHGHDIIEPIALLQGGQQLNTNSVRRRRAVESGMKENDYITTIQHEDSSLYVGYEIVNLDEKKTDTVASTRRMSTLIYGVPPIPEQRVFNGTDAESGRFPYYTAMYDKDGTFRCGGTLVASNIVLSAAHCQYVSCVCVCVILYAVI
jgi:hypothetical protein